LSQYAGSVFVLKLKAKKLKPVILI